MSYVDAYLNRDRDQINIVERVDGQPVFKCCRVSLSHVPLIPLPLFSQHCIPRTSRAKKTLKEAVRDESTILSMYQLNHAYIT